MSTQEDFEKIMEYAHLWNWNPDWMEVQKIYQKFPNSFSVLTPFAYSYLEEMIRSTTSEYGVELLDGLGSPKIRKVGIRLVNLAITENSNNPDYIALLEEIKVYFMISDPIDGGNNRNNVVHGYMHPRCWSKESFEQLLHKIATLSEYSKF